jgi:hypothetical protein
MLWTTAYLWIITMLFLLNIIINFYDAGKGDYRKISHRDTNLVAGLFAMFFATWGLLLIVGVIV